MVKSDPDERADYHEIAKYDEISKLFKNIVGINEYDKLKQDIEKIDIRLEGIRALIIKKEN